MGKNNAGKTPLHEFTFLIPEKGLVVLEKAAGFNFTASKYILQTFVSGSPRSSGSNGQINARERFAHSSVRRFREERRIERIQFYTRHDMNEYELGDLSCCETCSEMKDVFGLYDLRIKLGSGEYGE